MYHYYWNADIPAGGWILLFGIVLLLFSSIESWCYSYRAHQQYGTQPRKKAVDILNERYVRGEMNQEEYGQIIVG